MPQMVDTNCISNPSSVWRSGIPMTPALLIRRSIRGRSPMTRSAKERIDVSEERSSRRTSTDASGISARMSASAAVALSWLRAAMIT